MCQASYRYWEPNSEPGGMNPAPTELKAGRGREGASSRQGLAGRSSGNWLFHLFVSVSDVLLWAGTHRGRRTPGFILAYGT